MSERIEHYLRLYAVEAEGFLSRTEAPQNYAFFKEFIQKEALEQADWAYFQQMGTRINAFTSLAIFRGNALRGSILSECE